MTSKEWHRDRIKELEFERKNYSYVQKILIPTILGFTTIYLAILGIYLQDTLKYITQIIVGTEFYLFSLFLLLYLSSIAKKKDKPFLDKIKNNYDILLNRKK